MLLGFSWQSLHFLHSCYRWPVCRTQIRACRGSGCIRLVALLREQHGHLVDALHRQLLLGLG
jgi:hypothetical protein